MAQESSYGSVAFLSAHDLERLLERAIAEGVRLAIERLEKDSSPYLDTEGAAAYLGITTEALRGIVKRGSLRGFQPDGAHTRLYFSNSMLDDYVRSEP